METAYKVYHRNGGNFLDLTPNGEKSILFKTLLDHFNGDVESAIIAKSNVYSDEFFNWFGDWTARYNNKISSQNILYKIFDRGDKALYSPVEILKNIKSLFPDSDINADYDYEILSDFILDNVQNINSDIKIKFGKLKKGVSGEYNRVSHVITISEHFITRPNFWNVVNTTLHELVHAYTSEFLRDPNNKDVVNDLIKLKLYVEDRAIGTEYEDIYAFTNVGEFVSEFFANEDF